MIIYKNNSPVKKLKIWCVIGLLLSIYAAYVELRAEQDSNYVALCDVNKKISCTAVFTTIYGRGFGILQHILGTSVSSWMPPNGVIGFLFYALILISCSSKLSWINELRFFASIISNILSIYLAYLLYFVLQKICVICIAIYLVNFKCLQQIWRLRNAKQMAMENSSESQFDDSMKKSQ